MTSNKATSDLPTSCASSISEINDLQRILDEQKQQKAYSTNIGKRLPYDKSIQCYNIICKYGHQINTTRAIAVLINDILYDFISICDIDALCKNIAADSKFWTIFVSLLPIMSVPVFTSSLTVIFEAFLSSEDKYKDQFILLCSNVDSNRMIFDNLIGNLAKVSMRQSPGVIVDIIACISLYIRCMEALSKYAIQAAVILIPSLWFQMVECDFQRIVSTLLLSHNALISAAIIEKFIVVKRQLCDFLISIKLSEYATPLVKRLHEAMNNTITQTKGIQLKFEETNEEYHEMSSLNLLQAYDLIIFLENSNLTFKKSFSEQLLFGEHPFPLYKAIFRISDELHTFFSLHDNDFMRNPHIACFIINKEAFLYSLMCNQLRLWIESKSQSTEDLNSLLDLLPVILEKINDTIILSKFPQSSMHPSQLPSAASSKDQSNMTKALDIIDMTNYEAVRKWQLDKIKAIHYKKWAPHISDFDELLSTQVLDYVRHQRLLQLQKGTWVYAENPLDSKIKDPKLAFLHGCL